MVSGPLPICADLCMKTMIIMIIIIIITSLTELIVPLVENRSDNESLIDLAI